MLAAWQANRHRSDEQNPPICTGSDARFPGHDQLFRRRTPLWAIRPLVFRLFCSLILACFPSRSRTDAPPALYATVQTEKIVVGNQDAQKNNIESIDCEKPAWSDPGETRCPNLIRNRECLYFIDVGGTFFPRKRS